MNEKVMAAINLNAVLKSLELLCTIDKKATTTIAGTKLGVRFSVPTLTPLNLLFNQGCVHASFNKAEKTQIHLTFTSVEHFNKMINGKAMPIPTKGFFKLSFLQGAFTDLTNILTSILKPNQTEIQSNNELREKNTKLTAFVAFSALSEIANYDTIGQKIASHTPNGKLVVKVANEPFITVNVQNSQFYTEMQNFENPHAIMSFADIETAGKILRNEMDSFAAIGAGQLAISGKINMVDSINKLLGLVSKYLQ